MELHKRKTAKMRHGANTPPAQTGLVGRRGKEISRPHLRARRGKCFNGKRGDGFEERNMMEVLKLGICFGGGGKKERKSGGQEKW